MAIKHTKTSAIADSGDTSLVQPSDWNSDHTLDSGGIEIPLATSWTAASTGKVRIAAKDGLGLQRVGTVDQQGTFKELQTAYRSANPLIVAGIAGSNTLSAIGVVLTNTGTLTARTFGNGTVYGGMPKTGIVSAATAGSLSGTRSALIVANGNTGAKQNGFYYTSRFAISDAATVAGARMFVGMQNSAAAPTNVEPNTLINCVGIAQLSTDSTQLYICYGGTTAQTPIALGTGFPPTANIPYQLEINMPWQLTTHVYVTVTRLDNGAVFTQEIDGTATTLPSNNLTFQSWRTNNATALAVGLDISIITIEREL